MLRIIVLACVLFGLHHASAQQRAGAEVKRQVALTFDDLPSVPPDRDIAIYVTERLIRTLTANRVPAIGFVNEGKVVRGAETKERTALLRAWVEAGFELGNHTYSHISIDRAPVEAYKQDVIAGEKITRRLLDERQLRLRYFRHPQLRTGPTLEYKRKLDAFLARRGYTVAPVTIDNDEYIFAWTYTHAKARGDEAQMRRIADAYIRYMEEIFEFYERAAQEVVGREIKHILLLHANELNADHLEGLLRMMRGRGYSFISLEEALADPAYKMPEAQHKRGVSWLHRWALAKRQPLAAQPAVPEFIQKLATEARARQ